MKEKPFVYKRRDPRFLGARTQTCIGTRTPPLLRRRKGRAHFALARCSSSARPSATPRRSAATGSGRRGAWTATPAGPPTTGRTGNERAAATGRGIDHSHVMKTASGGHLRLLQGPSQWARMGRTDLPPRAAAATSRRSSFSAPAAAGTSPAPSGERPLGVLQWARANGCPWSVRLPGGGAQRPPRGPQERASDCQPLEDKVPVGAAEGNPSRCSSGCAPTASHGGFTCSYAAPEAASRCSSDARRRLPVCRWTCSGAARGGRPGCSRRAKRRLPVGRGDVRRRQRTVASGCSGGPAQAPVGRGHVRRSGGRRQLGAPVGRNGCPWTAAGAGGNPGHLAVLSGRAPTDAVGQPRVHLRGAVRPRRGAPVGARQQLPVGSGGGVRAAVRSWLAAEDGAARRRRRPTRRRWRCWRREPPGNKNKTNFGSNRSTTRIRVFVLGRFREAPAVDQSNNASTAMHRNVRPALLRRRDGRHPFSRWRRCSSLPIPRRRRAVCRDWQQQARRLDGRPQAAADDEAYAAWASSGYFGAAWPFMTDEDGGVRRHLRLKWAHNGHGWNASTFAIAAGKATSRRCTARLAAARGTRARAPPRRRGPEVLVAASEPMPVGRGHARGRRRIATSSAAVGQERLHLRGGVTTSRC